MADLASYYMDPVTWSMHSHFSWKTDDWETMLTLKIGSEAKRFVLSPWARSQVNTRMGVRPKWFETRRADKYSCEADERNLRGHYMKGAKLLLSNGEDDEALGIVRGVVGHGYKDIPYAFITKCLSDILPTSGAALFSREWSMVNYKRLHLMYLGAEELKFPGTLKTWRPGILLRSSEVGTSSFTIYPAMSFGDAHMPIVLKDAPVSFRRAHNCTDDDLLQNVHDGMVEASRFFTDPKSLRVLSLKDVEFNGKNEEEKTEAAHAAIEKACRNLRMTRRLEKALKEHYEAEEGLDHNGVRVLIGMQKMAEGLLLREEDAAVEMPQWTGALLFQLQS